MRLLEGYLQDPDKTVRESAGDALGHIAEHLFCQASVLTVGDSAQNPMLKAAFEVMLEQKKELQQAGAYAFSKVIRFSGRREQTSARLACWLRVAGSKRHCRTCPCSFLAAVFHIVVSFNQMPLS